MLCCAIPLLAIIVIIAVLAFFPGIWGIGLKNIALIAVLLLCPLMHIFMMRGHKH